MLLFLLSLKDSSYFCNAAVFPYNTKSVHNKMESYLEMFGIMFGIIQVLFLTHIFVITFTLFSNSPLFILTMNEMLFFSLSYYVTKGLTQKWVPTQLKRKLSFPLIN